MTLGECLEKMRKLINYYSVSGDRIASGDPALLDDMYRARSAVDTAQKELSRRCPLLRQITYTQHTLRPLDSRARMHYLEGSMTLAAPGAAAFSLLCDGSLRAVLEQEAGGVWKEVLTVAHTGSGRLETVHGELDSPPPQDAPMRLTLSAEGAYIASAGLYRTFPKYEEVPVLDLRRYHPLPADFGGVRSVTPSPCLPMTGGTDLTALAAGKIGLPWDFDGAVTIVYTVYPQTIGEKSSEEEELSVPEEAAEAIPYYAAAMLLTDVDPSLSQLFLNLYDDRAAALDGGTGYRVRNTLFGRRRAR